MDPSPDIHFSCPHCGQSLVGGRECLGTTIDCPGCAKPFVAASTPATAPGPMPPRQSLRADPALTAMTKGLGAIRSPGHDMAVIAVLLSLAGLSCLPPVSVAAVILGHVALVRCRRHGDGWRSAAPLISAAALVAGYLGMGVGLFVLVRSHGGDPVRAPRAHETRSVEQTPAPKIDRGLPGPTPSTETPAANPVPAAPPGWTDNLFTNRVPTNTVGGTLAGRTFIPESGNVLFDTITLIGKTGDRKRWLTVRLAPGTLRRLATSTNGPVLNRGTGPATAQKPINGINSSEHLDAEALRRAQDEDMSSSVIRSVDASGLFDGPPPPWRCRVRLVRVEDGRLVAGVYLCFDDADQSFIAGRFSLPFMPNDPVARLGSRKAAP